VFPPGSIHAVATVEPAEGVAGPALMLGQSLLRRFSMEATLAHSIRYAVWGEVWTNSQQDDVVISIARFVQWQVLFPGRWNKDHPFHDSNLFALLFMGLMPHKVSAGCAARPATEPPRHIPTYSILCHC
jgi:hypothetical protein